MRIMEQQARRLPWLKSFLQAEFYKRCESHNKYFSFFCRDCMKSTICEKCILKTNKHKGHKLLQVYRASRYPSIRIDIMKRYLDISDIHHFKINSFSIVYINQRPGNGEHNCGAEFGYCSIECKVKSETSIMEEPDVPKVTNASASNTKRKYVQPPNSFRKRSRKGIPIRSPLF